MLRTIISIWRDFSSQMKKQNISAYASSTAFFLFLSVIPMLMVVCAVIPYTPVTEQNLITALTDVTPDIADAMVESLVVDVYESSVGILPVALIAMVWSAAKGVMALMRGLNAVNGVDEKRNYFVIRFIASFYTLIMLVVLILSLFFMVFESSDEFPLSVRMGGADSFVWTDLYIYPGHKAEIHGTGSGSLLCCGSMECIFLGIFHVCVLWKWV